MKKVLFLISTLIFANGSFAAPPTELELTDVKNFIAKTRYLVSGYGKAMDEKNSGHPEMMMAMNKDVLSLYKEGIDKFSLISGHSRFSDCTTMSTEAYNLWSVLRSASTDDDVTKANVTNENFIKAMGLCKKNLNQQTSAPQNKNNDNLAIIDLDPQ